MNRLSTLFLMIILIINTQCTLPLYLGYIEFNNIDETYQFNFSKNELQKRIVDTYTDYQPSLFNKTIIENIYVTYIGDSTNVSNKSILRRFAPNFLTKIKDTLEIKIGKFHTRKAIHITIILTGDNTKSSLRIIMMDAQRKRAFSKEREFYKNKIIAKIEQKFIQKLNNSAN